MISEELAKELHILQKHAVDGVLNFGEQIKLSDFSKEIREEYLTPIMKDWYFLHLSEGKGSTILWQTSFYSFAEQYLNKFHKDNYILSADSSLNIMLQETNVCKQLIIYADQNVHKNVILPNGYGLFILQGKKNINKIQSQNLKGLNAYTLADSLLEINETFYINRSLDAEMALKMVKDPAEFIINATSGYSRKIGKVMGAYEHIGMTSFANKIKGLCDGFKITPVVSNPFKNNYVSSISSLIVDNPAALRVSNKWVEYETFLSSSLDLSSFQVEINLEIVKTRIKEDFLKDAYNSLSIEGYKITPEIIEALRNDAGYKNNKDALAAKGYKKAFNLALQNIEENFNKPNTNYLSHANEIRQQLFMPMVEAKVIGMNDIVGYRNHAVYIRNAVHVPVSTGSVGACMKSLEESINKDTHPIIKAILTHLFFVYIHPYGDGNGRTARFLMNEVLSTNGYEWVIVPEEKRDEYFSALEAACSGGDIMPFAKFITSLMSAELKASLEVNKNKLNIKSIK